MKIGVRVHDYGKGSPELIAKRLSDEGYEAVQLAIPKSIEGIESYDQVSDDLISRIRNAFSAKKIEVSVLGCYVDLSNPDNAIRLEAVRTFCRGLEVAVGLGARVTGTETSYEHLGKLEKRRRFPCLMESLEIINEKANSLNADFAIEPVAWNPLEDVETAREVTEKLGKHSRIILDLANVLENPNIIQQDSYWRYVFELLGDKISAIHLKDFVTDTDGKYRPMLLGEGVLQYDVLEEWLRGKESMPVLREEMNPETAAHDICFMQDMKRRTE